MTITMKTMRTTTKRTRTRTTSSGRSISDRLLGNPRKTRSGLTPVGAKQFLTRFAVRAAPFALPSFLLLMLVAVCWSPLTAQKNKKDEDAGTRIVQGQVVDPDDQPVVGAVVQLKDMH